MQVEYWYKEFIRMGWTKAVFDKHLKIIKRTTLYNRIDLENWLSTEIMYNEDDFNIEVKRKIDAMIQRGNFLKDKKVELTEEDKKFIELAEVKKIEFELKNKRYELMESAAEQMRREYLDKLSEKKKKLAKLSLQEKMKIVDGLFRDGKVEGKPEGFVYNTVLHNIEDYADLITL